MKIALSDAGKRYNRDWIYRHLSYSFEKGNAYAITGTNGSGKSTLLQNISGAIMLNEGSCEWYDGYKKIDAEKVYRHISICAPYLELVEEFNLVEFFEFHQSFKKFIAGLSIKNIIDEIGLAHVGEKRISQYSSGMKQRVKLAQCIFSDADIVLLDEPCTNLDEQGIALYHALISKYCNNRLVIVSSNDPVEYSFCNKFLSIMDYKPGV